MKKNNAAVESLLTQDREQVLAEWRAELAASGGGRGLSTEVQGAEQLLEAVLADFGVKGRITAVRPGSSAGWVISLLL